MSYLVQLMCGGAHGDGSEKDRSFRFQLAKKLHGIEVS
jgi:hypothetical protein